MAVTQKQIAEKLGLSQPIVAQALNGHAGVAQATRQRVIDEARALGYGPHSNSAARSLIARRHGTRPQTGSLAVLMGSISQRLSLRDTPFFQPILRGIELEAVERNLDLAFCIASRDHLPRLVTEQGVDGLISLYNNSANALLRAHHVNLPVVRVGDATPGETVLMPDNFQGVRLATRHLIELGHRRIAYMGDLKSVPHVAYNARLDGYFQALKEGGIEVNDAWIEGECVAKLESGAAGLERLLQRAPNISALVCFNDLPALGAIHRARELGLRVPEDLSVVGFDDTAGEYDAEIALTTVAFDRENLGRRAVQLLCEAENLPLVKGEVLPVELLVRASTARVAG